jgi:hypothetical protein
MHEKVIYIRQGGSQPTAAELEACECVVLVSHEPFWMADIRAAVRRIDAQRLALRARGAPEGGSPSRRCLGITGGPLPPFGTPA